jgi:hypothetical protein
LDKFFAKRECVKQGCAEHQCDKQECDKQKSDNSGGTAKRGEIRNIFYLKSSDGNPKKTAAQGKKDKNENQSDDKPEHISVTDLRQPPPLPIGPGQMDYFHRLTEEIRNVHDTVDFDKRDSGAKAVVILGSDFNDKLLIIEALREKMPHLLILTTDLDARMLYPKHWRSTRNLVVASHFDLRLREKPPEDKDEADKDYQPRFWQRAVQAQFPPFRDSHQTNIFYRTLAIAEGNASSIDDSEKTFPHIFEVGRNGFVRLDRAQENEGPGYYPPDNTLQQTKWRLLLLFIIAISLIAFHSAIRPWSKILSGYFFISTFCLFVIAFAFIFGTDGSGEPLSFTDGVSLWPTIFIQVIAVLLAVALFIRAICELERNFCCLSRQYFRNCLPHFTGCENVSEPDECGRWLYSLLSYGQLLSICGMIFPH